MPRERVLYDPHRHQHKEHVAPHMVDHATKFGVPAPQRATCNLEAHVTPITDVLYGTRHLKSAKAHVRRQHGRSRHTENVNVNTQHYFTVMRKKRCSTEGHTDMPNCPPVSAFGMQRTLTYYSI